MTNGVINKLVQIENNIVNAASAPAATCGGRAHNIAGGRDYSLLELLQLLGDIMGASSEPNHVAARPGDVRCTLADLQTAGADLDYRPTVQLRDGLERFVAWFAENRC